MNVYYTKVMLNNGIDFIERYVVAKSMGHIERECKLEFTEIRLICKDVKILNVKTKPKQNEVNKC